MLQTCQSMEIPCKSSLLLKAVPYLAGKHFTQERGCEKILFGHDDIVDRDSEHPGAVRRTQRLSQGVPEDSFSIEHIGRLIIVEGELDKMACNEVRHSYEYSWPVCILLLQPHSGVAVAESHLMDY